MVFYRFTGIVTDNELVEQCDDRSSMRQITRNISTRTEDFNGRDKDSIYFVSSLDDGKICICAAGNNTFDPEKKIDRFCDAIGVKTDTLSCEEIMFRVFRHMLSSANRNSFIGDDDEIIESLDLGVLDCRNLRGINYGENILDTMSKSQVMKLADKYLINDNVLPEFNRIYAGKQKSKAMGHPVHYIVESDDHDTRNDIYKTLLAALYDNGRISSRRYNFIDFRPGDEFSTMALNDLYGTTVGGTIVIRYMSHDDRDDNNYASGDRETIENICVAINKYKNDVLTIICLPRECTRSKNIFYENLEGMSFVELKEDMASGEGARHFLSSLAHENHIRTDKNLLSKVEEDQAYLSNDLRLIFDDWFNKKLRNTVFPQYKECSSAKKLASKEEDKGSAYDRLQGMIGLKEAKETIQQALDFYKVQHLYKDRGISTGRPAMHMIFTGNPGTAKTTVARLFAQIMKENGLLSKGNLIEVGRADLVGKYVGHTAPLVKKKFQEALGSVLFIDEAYSLVDDKDGMYGDEAINTIVQEMENHRDELVVIFAGYPDKMEGFLDKNPGLRSRIAFHVPFDDYNEDELLEIAEHIAKSSKINISEEAKEKMKDIFKNAIGDDDFGNGRYVRNLIELSRMKQAGRIVKIDPEKITKKDITTLMAEDIEAVKTNATPQKCSIGFCA